MTIFEYFKTHLDAEPEDGSLSELSVDSECGSECKLVIDAAKAMMRVSDPAAFKSIRNAAHEAVEIYWRG